MAVTITPSANPALNTDLLLTGTLGIEDALDDKSESLAVSVYNATTGATFNGVSQVYDSSTTATYTFANGTVFSVNFGTGVWTYQRLSSEVGSSNFSYTFTFDWNDSAGTTSKTITVTTTNNVVVNSIYANTLDDMDEYITGIVDVSIVRPVGVDISIEISANGVTLAGASKPITSLTDKISWNFVDGSLMEIDLATKTFSYKRVPANVGDNTVDSYSIVITISGIQSFITCNSVVGFKPVIKKFTANSADDTETTITGNLQTNTVSGANIEFNVVHNSVRYNGAVKSYTPNSQITWQYADGSSLVLDTTTNTWTYRRTARDTSDLVSDKYTFELEINNKYGNDADMVDVVTTIPKATIVSFYADNILDTSNVINGTLDVLLPVIANNPTLAIDISVNGATYFGQPSAFGTTAISYSYNDGSTLIVDVANKKFTFNRAKQDVDTADTDIYVFECIVNVNGQDTSQVLTVKTMAGARTFDYETAYPVNIQAGSTETQATAWSKYSMEMKRMYRLLNENLNYYENLSQQTQGQMAALKEEFESALAEWGERFESLYKEIQDALANLKIKTITGVAYHGETLPIPEGAKRENCTYIACLHHWPSTNTDNKYTFDEQIYVDQNTGVLTCWLSTWGRDGTNYNGGGYANYLVIDNGGK